MKGIQQMAETLKSVGAQTEKCVLDENKIDRLRSIIAESGCISQKRFAHTVGVEDECRSLSGIFGLDSVDCLRLCAAGLLHDITKEKKLPEQLELCRRYNIDYPPDAVFSPKVFHGWTAAAEIREKYAGYSDPEICRAVSVHTTGRAEMTLFESLLYLADYIEPGRSFPDCVTLRKYFYSRIESERAEDRRKILTDTLIKSFDMTVLCLISDGAEIFSETMAARNSLIRERRKENNRV